MAINHTDIVDVEMNSGGIFRSFCDRSIGKDDDEANVFGVRVLRDSQPESLSGASCKGYFTDSCSVRTTINGSINGNTAIVTLPDDCYVNEGHFMLAIKLTTNSEITTVRIVDGVVRNTFA